MQWRGKIVSWQDDRGFGFVEPDGGGQQVFLHISALPRGARRPLSGDRIAFTLGKGRDGKPAVNTARLLNAPVNGSHSPTPSYFDSHAIRVWAAALLIALVFATISLAKAPIWLLALYAIMGLLAFGLYALDKAAAQTGNWRIAEARLHGIDAACGIIGGLLAQQVLRHKTAKPQFSMVTGGIALLHGLVLIGLLLDLMPIEEIAAAIG